MPLIIDDMNFLNQIVADAITQASLTCQSKKTARSWVRAIAKAKAFIDNDTTFLHYNHEDKTLLIFSDSNEIYSANGVCQCKAYTKGDVPKPCYHRAMARIVRNYYELQERPAKAAAFAEVN